MDGGREGLPPPAEERSEQGMEGLSLPVEEMGEGGAATPCRLMNGEEQSVQGSRPEAPLGPAFREVPQRVLRKPSSTQQPPLQVAGERNCICIQTFIVKRGFATLLGHLHVIVYNNGCY